MELKDVILSTLAELGEEPIRDIDRKTETSVETGGATEESKGRESAPNEPLPLSTENEFIREEREFLERMRERLLVLFEGFQSPNNKRLEAKIDLTLNFLEYLLATLDERIERLKKP